MFWHQARDSLQQIAVPLARDQLASRGDCEHAFLDAEFLSESVALRFTSERSCINCAANDSDALIFNVVFAQDLGDRFRYRDDFSKRLVTQRRHQPHLGVIHPARYDGRNIGVGRREPAKQISTATAVAMDDVRRVLFQELRKSVSKRQIEVARAEEILHTNSGHSCDPVDTGIGRTNQRVVMTSLV